MKCILSFANNRGNYYTSFARLANSIKGNFDGDFIGFIGERSVGSPIHSDNPYAFKIYCWIKAIELGYTKILWLDSSCVVIKNVQPIFDVIEKDGYFIQDIGHKVGNWTNDKTLNYFGITRDEAMLINCYGDAGFLGLNFDNDIAIDFFKQWSKSLEAGMFKGEWTNQNKTESQDERCFGHRHDLSCGSIIAHKLAMKLQKGDEWLDYAHPGTAPKNETIIIQAEGM